LTRVSQAAPREYTQPRKESSGARSGSQSPWGTGETKKRIVDALKNELSDIHLYTGDITTNSCAKVNYATICQMYAPKHEMKKFRPIFKRLIESKIAMKGPFEVKAKASNKLNHGIPAARIQVLHTHFYMTCTISMLAKITV
jgi:hypothetical protein